MTGLNVLHQISMGFFFLKLSPLFESFDQMHDVIFATGYTMVIGWLSRRHALLMGSTSTSRLLTIRGDILGSLKSRGDFLGHSNYLNSLHDFLGVLKSCGDFLGPLKSRLKILGGIKRRGDFLGPLKSHGGILGGLKKSV